MDSPHTQSAAVAPRRVRRTLAFALAALVVALLVLGVYLIGRPRDTLVSESPDRSHRIVVQEGFRHIDRNFRILLVDRRTGARRVIFTSYDQSPSITQERFVWSTNSSKVVLLGDRYYVVPGSKLENGEIVFLMYDIEHDRLSCNTDHDRGFQRVSAQEVVEIFGEDLGRKQR
jgi:hypothetical protein